MSRTCVVSYENRNLEYKERFRANHKDYCDAHGYDYVSLDTHVYENIIPPYWLKVYIVYEYIQKYDVVMWMDSDTAFESKTPIDELFRANESADLIISGDKPQHKKPARLNTGVFILSKSGIELLTTWLEMYPQHRWTFDGSRWKCGGKWSGADYEQGSLERMLGDERWRDRIALLPWHFMNNHPRSGHGGFVYHFCGAVGKKMLARYR